MFGEKFATRLNSFASKPEIFWQKSVPLLGPEQLIDRASTVKGLTDLDLNFPDHAGKNLNNIVKSMIIWVFAMLFCQPFWTNK